MTVPYEVREFEKLIIGNKYKRDNGIVEIPKITFDRFCTYIKEFNDTKENSEILNFFKLGFNRWLGDYVAVGNYVGLVQMPSGEQIQILPKIDLSTESEGSDSGKCMQVFLNMLMCLKNFRVKLSKDANLHVSKMNLYEFLIAMFVSDVGELLRVGLKANYIEVTENINYYKGKLLFAEQVKRNFGHKEKFYMKYDEYHKNSPANKLIKTTLVKLLRETEDAENKKRIRQLLNGFDDIDISHNYECDFAKVVIDRNSVQYASVIDWCKVFLYNNSFSAFSGSSEVKSMLFPMNVVYEAYVAKNMCRCYEDEDLEIFTQYQNRYLFESPCEKFRLKPDIVIKRKGFKPIILDTKWKQLNNDENHNFNISGSDMYQMYAYSRKYLAEDIWLLYPWNRGIKDTVFPVFESRDLNMKTTTKIHIYPIRVDRIEHELLTLKDKFAWVPNA